MKTFFLVISFIGCATWATGQTNIQGTIRDQHQVLPSVTVLLLRIDSTNVAGVATDIDGRFTFTGISAGNYRISASMVGYNKYFSDEFAFNNEPITLPEIILRETVTSLDEVIIKSEKIPIEQQIDRTIIHLESRVTSAGNTMLEILQKSPGVVVNKQTNTISLNGKTGVRIMINEKILQVPMDVALQMLEGMSSSNVERIELITNPSSAYDAEGSGGIIHIVSRELSEYGTNATVGATLGYRSAETFGGSINVHHRSQKFAGFLDYAGIRNHNLHIVRMTKRTEMDNYFQMTSNDSHRENITTQQNLNTGFTWMLNKKNTVDLSASLFERDWNMNAVTNDVHRVTPDSIVTTSMDVWESNRWESATASLSLTHRFNSNSDLRFSADYLYYYNSNPSNYDLLQNDHPAFAIDLQKTTPLRTQISALDYQVVPSMGFILNTGMKYVTSRLDNQVTTQRRFDQEWIVDPDFSSSSRIEESIAALYIASQWKPSDHWQIHTGLRYEYTQTSISTPLKTDSVNRRYGYLFPNFSIQKTFGKERDFQFSYARRITRPTYNDMAPYVFFWSANTFSAGNTSLYPAIADAITIGLHIKQWASSLQLTHVSNEITMMQPEIQPGSQSFIFRSQNLDYLNSIALTNSYLYTVASWWEVQGNLVLQYQTGKTSYLANDVTLHQFGCNLNLVNTFKLPKDFSLEVSGTYQSQSLSGISRFLPFGSLNAGIQKNFGGKGILRFSIDDILYTNYWKIKTYSAVNNIDSYFQYNWHNQFVRLTYTYNFGNSKLRSVKLKSSSEEERRRIAN